jgi:hypothetical protein
MEEELLESFGRKEVVSPLVRNPLPVFSFFYKGGTEHVTE